MWPAARRRPDSRDPVGRPVSASRVISAMTTRSYTCLVPLVRAAIVPLAGAASHSPAPPSRLGLVLPAEDLGYGAVLEDGVDGVGEDLGHRDDLDLVDLLLGRQGKGVGDHD